MGLLDNQNTYNYYTYTSDSSLKTGGYQFVTLDNIINAFMVAYVGENKILSKVSRTDVQFHAMRAIQELSYDVFRSIKSHEITVPSTLRMPLPMDYVNYIKIVRVDNNGIERVLYPTSKSSNPFAIQQYDDGAYYIQNNIDNTFGEDLEEKGTRYTNHNVNNETDSTTEPFNSTALNNFQTQSSGDSYSDDTTDLEVDHRGRRYGLDPQHAQSNGTFILDNRTGFIHFGSSLNGETVILKYVSDGLGSDDEMVAHKFCEEAVYKWIMYGVLSTRSNVPEGIVQRFKKEKFAETRKAKIRLSNIKIEEFTQILKGMSKQIK